MPFKYIIFKSVVLGSVCPGDVMFSEVLQTLSDGLVLCMAW